MSAASQSPIFIVGVSSSGTTLLRNILWAHARCYSTHETGFFSAEYRSERWTSIVRSNMETIGAQRPELPKSCAEYTTSYILKLSEEYEHRRDFVDAYFRQLRKYNQGRIWVEKTPSHLCRLPEIKADFPESRVVCLTRDPLYNVVSLNRRKWFTRDFQNACSRWNESIQCYLENTKHIDWCIAYEWLCTDGETAVRQLFEVLELPYNFEEQRFHEILTSPQARHCPVWGVNELLRTPERRPKEVTDDQRTIFESICGSLLKRPELRDYLNEPFYGPARRGAD